ncbi:23S rRNA (guanosine(2251)-2'-O)-methyltransferase RlmB [Thermoflexus sp.]|uniref:23S rRNA (guanosine(2251)-2'-O)-methyltransferase RlmB n=2 Tax=Thermoflexus sp. TaxID=1969742 RepID=UPI0025DA82D8|nr:23S rRNA (guanosine(2251)-2'-O)-methyltransferase RlmB [Thermoflexus sp.]MCS6964700.1 23S rRNA (guanosine(2251)-2'-O)-methyltransferase RlmB [Thermoflexus sp.]MCS7351741.1 23S rRNA (guanosine(2251)-2'-O)-methyltransferase RlmB [Thermoflexus sp.]MDW8181199.1 23S rRNA (guanosine(2251)-2'-O)-methyltransferase RlmB [Anaerolineae bacterium]
MKRMEKIQREFLYGRHAVHEALRAGRRRIYRLLIAEGLQPRPILEEIRAMATDRGIPLLTVPRARLDAITDGHQGVVAEADPYPYVDLEQAWAESAGRPDPPFWLALDCLQDPQNFGTLLRTAEATGVHAVLFPEHRSARVTPAVVNASAGAVEHLHMAQVTNLARALEQLKERGIWIVGLQQDPRAIRYDQADLGGPIALVVGNEESGIRPLVRRVCDFLIYLPMRGRVASLNAATAGAVALYEIARRRDFQ